jgi:hypothetical protein
MLDVIKYWDATSEAIRITGTVAASLMIGTNNGNPINKKVFTHKSLFEIPEDSHFFMIPLI